MAQDLPTGPNASQNPPCRADKMDLPTIDPLDLDQARTVADLIDHVYARSGYNARRLAEAAQLYRRMIEEGATICMTLAGAMTPIGMSGIINTLIKAGFIDAIISTGANLYHDLHRPFLCPMMQGHFMVDDNELADQGVARIYDVFIEDLDTLQATDRIILQTVQGIQHNQPMSTAAFHHQLGKQVQKSAPKPQWSMLATAAGFEVPIYTSSPGDSSIAMNLAVPHLYDQPIRLDPLQDVLETAAIVRAADKNGVVIVGGGSPKNFYLQTQPTLHQIFMDDSRGGHDYFIQLGVDTPQWGGLSGATPSEARSWGKLKDAVTNNVVVYSCASLTLPLLARYVLARCEPRSHRRLLGKMDTMLADFRAAADRNPKFQESLKMAREHYLS
jgi:deoxyhypusine synthase